MSKQPRNLHVLEQPKKIERRQVKEKKELRQTLRDEIDTYPPSLRELALLAIDIQKMPGIKALCHQAFPFSDPETGEVDDTRRQRKYENVIAQIRRLEKEGKDFRDLLIRIHDDLNKLRQPAIIEMLHDEAVNKKNLKAAELFLKATGALGGKRASKKGEDAASTPLTAHRTPEFRDPED